MAALESRLTLHRFICAQFGHATLQELLARMDSVQPDAGEDAMSNFALALSPRLNSDSKVSEEELARYDENIGAHSRALGVGGDSARSWKAFQYAALLFTERYLDLYFADAEALAEMLNAHLADERAARLRDVDGIADYAPNDLRTLAFQSATGSGKTLLLHAHILQYQHYLRAAGQLHKLNKIILVTPDEGMSRQHLNELRASNLPARLFSDEAGGEVFARGGVVEIIDLHKLDEKKGVKRVALESFEDNNLVMVDEGHLGSGGKVWRERRRQLAHNGFTFEYSATFNQAVAAPAMQALRDAYGKSILFDYSYRFFYEDGYGKDYQISNLRDDDDAHANDLYLLACLLAFYQQCKIFADMGGAWREFNIAKPLWVFLGKTVTGGKLRKETGSDVARIIAFLARVLGKPREAVAGIRTIIGGGAELTDAHGANLFANSFDYIADMPPQKIYDDMCAHVFHGKGELHAAHLTGGDELQLRAGDCMPFGVINVGDAAGLYAKLEADAPPHFSLAKSAFAAPLFGGVDSDNSPVNIVIGARKFAAGWNSWRVSTMGLMHVGRGEGPQIIQMFGRGVRLKGLHMSLKRHTELGAHAPHSAQLKLLETLNIFGLRANYMEQFRAYLQEQGVGARMVQIRVPTAPAEYLPAGLKIPRRGNAHAFETSDVRVTLPPQPDERDFVTLDRYKHLQTLQPDGAQGGEDAREVCVLEKPHIDLLDARRIYHKALARKQRENWHNLMITRECVDALLQTPEWYRLYMPHEKLAAESYARVQEWEELAADLVCAYARRHWRRARNAWEHESIAAEPLLARDPNFISEYVVSVAAHEHELVAQIESMAKAVANGKYERSYSIGNVQVQLLNLGFHAYAPLLHVAADAHAKVKVTPVPLNRGEAEFVELLRNVVDAQPGMLARKEIFLMRNMSRGAGISFFNDHAFYPDFILWCKDSTAQDILFIDPKGLARYDAADESKVDLHTKIKETQRKLQQTTPRIYLHSYVWSVTHPHDIVHGGLMNAQLRRKKGVYLAAHGARELPALLEDAFANREPPA